MLTATAVSIDLAITRHKLGINSHNILGVSNLLDHKPSLSELNSDDCFAGGRSTMNEPSQGNEY